MWGTAAVRDHTEFGDGFNRSEIAQYVAALSDDLARLANQSGFELLEYLLKMVRLEAETLNQLEAD